MVWHTANTSDIPYPIMNPETRNSGSSDVIEKISIPTAKQTKPKVIMPFGPLVS